MLAVQRRSLLQKLRHFVTAVTPIQYEKAANESLERLSDYLDTLPEKIVVSSEFDVSNAMGVVTIVVSKTIGTYVINKQSPNLQIWLSSPISGPKRYDLVDNKWIYSHDGDSLDALLTREFRKILGDDGIDFKGHL